MGPMRVDWTFPYKGTELVEQCKKKEAALAAEIDESIDEEQEYERELADYRERLRKAGVEKWQHAQLDPTHNTYSRNPTEAFRQRQTKRAKELKELSEFRRQLEHDLERDKDRLYKLTIDDVRFFGL